jgi:hypothetical protein
MRRRSSTGLGLKYKTDAQRHESYILPSEAQTTAVGDLSLVAFPPVDFKHALGNDQGLLRQLVEQTSFHH